MYIMRSPIFYMGNKYKLLKRLLRMFPTECDIFIDLFGGSGVVSMNYHGTEKTIYNELNENVIGIIKMIKNNDPDDLDKYFHERIDKYQLETCSIKSDDRIDRTGYERRAEPFKALRDDYNKSNPRNYKDLYLLSCYSVNHLMRFNSKNEFNVSSGADSYNDGIYRQIKDLHNSFKNVEVSNQDAFNVDLSTLTNKSFIYLDPPYSNTSAVYNEKRAFGGWSLDDDKRLFTMLEQLNKRGVRWGMSNVFENRGIKNQHLIDWCEKNGWCVQHLERSYNPFSKKGSESDEVYICNYEPTEKVYTQLKLF